MKKIISLIIALALMISLVSVVSVAFAEDAVVDHAVVTCDDAAFESKVSASKYTSQYLADSASFEGWLTVEDLTTVFPGVVFDVKETKNNDTIRLEYTQDYPRYEENWQKDDDAEFAAVGLKMDLTGKLGWIAFRYAVEYKVSTAADAETKTVYSPVIVRYVVDETNPVVELGSTLKDKQEKGLTAETAYTISTSASSSSSYLKVTDSDKSVKVTYVVKKVVDGTEKVIYDSVDGIVDGYEGTDIKNGVITPGASDVSDNTVYTIVYTITDAVGRSATQELKLKVVAKTVVATEGEKKVDVLKIVLYVVAGLSACGIIVLLCVKPKKSNASTRVVYTENTSDDKTDNQ